MTGFDLLKSLNGRVKEVHMACSRGEKLSATAFGTYRVDGNRVFSVDGRDVLIFTYPVESHRFISPGILLVRYRAKANIVPQKLIDQFDPGCLLNGQGNPVDTDVVET